MNKKYFYYLLFILFLGSYSLALAYTPLATSAAGLPLKHLHPSSLVWNLENGFLDDQSQAHNFNNEGEIAEFCGQNFSGSLAPGSGGCSLNPFLKSLYAQTLSRQQSVDIIANAWQEWMNSSEAMLRVTQGPNLDDSGDVTICNLDRFIAFLTPYQGVSDPRICGCIQPRPASCTSECKKPIIFDSNGDIIEYLERRNGSSRPINDARLNILARAGAIPYPFDRPTHYIAFSVIINGACLEGSALDLCGATRWTLDDIRSTITHELGHALGLGHSSVIDSLRAAEIARINPQAIPTMYPRHLTREMMNLNTDDKMGLAFLYPREAPLSQRYCSLNGNFQLDGSDLRCVEIIAQKYRSVAGSRVYEDENFISVLSGNLSPNNSTPSVAQNTCLSNCGAYQIEGLEPSASYQIKARSIYNITRSSSLGPCGTSNTQFSERVLADTFLCPSTAGDHRLP